MVLKLGSRQAVGSSVKIELLRIVCHSKRIDIKKEGITVDGFSWIDSFQKKILVYCCVCVLTYINFSFDFYDHPPTHTMFINLTIFTECFLKTRSVWSGTFCSELGAQNWWWSSLSIHRSSTVLWFCIPFFLIRPQT